MVALTHAANQLDEVESIGEVVKIRDIAEAVRSQGRKFKLAEEVAITASVVKLRASRRLGEMIQQLKEQRLLSAGGRPSRKKKGLPRDTGITLDDIGISKSDSARSQSIADIPGERFERYISEQKDKIEEVSVRAAVQIARQLKAKRKAKSLPREEGYVTDLADLIGEGKKFATLYADPPWRYNNTASNGAAEDHYPTMSMGELFDEPVAEVAADSAHLFLWVGGPFLAEGLELMEAWGFRFRSNFVWVKPQMGTGNYLRMAHELMLIGDRGVFEIDHELLLFGNRGGEPVMDHGIRSWAEYPRREHSRKPDEIIGLIERLSPGPYLELYSRNKPRPGWTCYGNEIVRS